jgi:RNA polymerase sigma-70 factor (ECF subfamily)
MSLGTDPSSVEDDALFARARAGDEAAWEALFHKCYPKVIRVVRRKLNPPMRSMFDSTDFASDVMKSLAANAERLDFPSFQSLMAFLARVAEQKVIDEYRKAHTLKRDLGRTFALSPDDGEGGHPLAVASDDPTPSQVAQAGEVHEQLLAGQGEPGRALIALKEQGYTCHEIATETGWNLRKVQRFFQGLHETYVRVTGGAT